MKHTFYLRRLWCLQMENSSIFIKYYFHYPWKILSTPEAQTFCIFTAATRSWRVIVIHVIWWIWYPFEKYHCKVRVALFVNFNQSRLNRVPDFLTSKFPFFSLTRTSSTFLDEDSELCFKISLQLKICDPDWLHCNCHGHLAKKWQSWDLNLAPDTLCFTIELGPHPEKGCWGAS